MDFNWTDWYGPPSFLLRDPQIFFNLAYAYVSNKQHYFLQSFVAATSIGRLADFEIDGILGLGPARPTSALSGARSTLLENLVAQGKLESSTFGLWYSRHR